MATWSSSGSSEAAEAFLQPFSQPFLQPFLRGFHGGSTVNFGGSDGGETRTRGECVRVAQVHAAEHYERSPMPHSGPMPEHWRQTCGTAMGFWDDVTGEPLDQGLVVQARAEEMKEFQKHGVYTKVPIAQCFTDTGKPPIAVRWVDINKGDQGQP